MPDIETDQVAAFAIVLLAAPYEIRPLPETTGSQLLVQSCARCIKFDTVKLMKSHIPKWIPVPVRAISVNERLRRSVVAWAFGHMRALQELISTFLREAYVPDDQFIEGKRYAWTIADFELRAFAFLGFWVSYYLWSPNLLITFRLDSMGHRISY